MSTCVHDCHTSLLSSLPSPLSSFFFKALRKSKSPRVVNFFHMDFITWWCQRFGFSSKEISFHGFISIKLPFAFCISRRSKLYLFPLFFLKLLLVFLIHPPQYELGFGGGCLFQYSLQLFLSKPELLWIRASMVPKVFAQTFGWK